MAKPVLLDLFCGAGGAARGYQKAGFLVVGVDIEPQPNYVGDEFNQADALEFLTDAGGDFDAIHASPPCQGYSVMRFLPWLKGREYPLLLKPIISALGRYNVPWVVENVVGARKNHKGLLRSGLEDHGLEAGWLCGGMFGLPFYRHRLFASNVLWLAPHHPAHQRLPKVYSPDGRAKDQRISLYGMERKASGLNDTSKGQALGHQAGWKEAAKMMEIDWMNREELTQAIPPAYTEHIGRQLL